MQYDYNAIMARRKELFVERNELDEAAKKKRLELIDHRVDLYKAGREAIQPLADPPYFDEMSGSPTEDWTPTSLTATRTLKCAWNDRYAVGDWHTTPPNDMYPYANPGMAYTSRLGIAPADDSCSYANGLASYEEAIITLQYVTLNGSRPGTQDPSPSGATLIEEEIQPSIELINLEAGDFHWGSGTGDMVDLDEVPAYRKLSAAYNVTLYGITSIAKTVIDYGGYCHSLAYVSRTIGWSFPPETLLYSPPTMTRSVSVLGATTGWTVRIPWAYQPQTWNKYLNKTKLKPGEDPWEEIFYSDGTRLEVAPPIDLSSMLP